MVAGLFWGGGARAEPLSSSKGFPVVGKGLTRRLLHHRRPRITAETRQVHRERIARFTATHIPLAG